MAQAARLNLRLQKELKLLLTDPPHGSSFPSLSSSSSPSLSSLHAQIEGPEGTVYEKGLFQLKIQIPDRYPFQPPIVTFATPIYHPNIDNGGRICLDILNLPPKGAWQPSLNISTVLTSIGLLLSEPNPDDGLMHEVSKEYKYNRQAFDQKARSMTEKYARPVASQNANGDDVNQSLLDDTSVPMEAKDSDTSTIEPNKGFVNNKTDVSTCETNKSFFSNKNISGTSKKLSLELLGSNQKKKKSNVEEYVSDLTHNQMDTGDFEQISVTNSIAFHQNHEEVQETKQKPLSRSLSLSEKRSNEDSGVNLQQDMNALKQHPDQDIVGKTLTASHQQSAFLSHSPVSDQTISRTHISNHMEKQSSSSPVIGNGDGFTSTRHKKLGLAGRRLRLGVVGSSGSQIPDNKENLIPEQSSSAYSTSSVMVETGEKLNKFTTSVSHKKLRGITCKQPLKPVDHLWSNDDNTMIKAQSGSKTISKSYPLLVPRHDKKLQDEENYNDEKSRQQEESLESENIVVLDSEDSEEETKVSDRFKYSLTRKRLLEKRKAKYEATEKS